MSDSALFAVGQIGEIKICVTSAKAMHTFLTESQEARRILQISSVATGSARTLLKLERHTHTYIEATAEAT